MNTLEMDGMGRYTNVHHHRVSTTNMVKSYMNKHTSVGKENMHTI